MHRTTERQKMINKEGVVHTPFYYGWLIVVLAGLSHFFQGHGKPIQMPFLLITISRNSAGAARRSPVSTPQPHCLPVSCCLS